MNIQHIMLLLGRGIRLLCPRCGESPLFAGFFAMRPQCPSCHLVFEREQGYFVGAIYINYAATTVLSIAGFLALDAFSGLSLTRQLALWGVFAVVFPLFFFRYSRSLWLSIDHICTPADPPGAKRNLLPLRRRSHS